MNLNTDIIIIGAGITGLTIAHHLNRAGKKFIVLEKNNRIGGVINTIQKDGFTFENGPNTGVIGQPDVVELFDELKDSIQLEQGNELVNKRYILKNKKWIELPHGHKGITTPLFKWKDKFRLLGEPFRKPGTNPNETLAELVKRRMGQSFLDYAVDPFILGVYAGDPNQLVTRFALPKLYHLEQDYGSFIKGAIRKSKIPKTELEKRTNRAVFSFEGGLSNLTNALYQSAGPSNFILDTQKITINPNSDGTFKTSYLKNNKTIEITAKKVVTTIGSYALPDLLPFLEAEQKTNVSNLKYAKVIEASIGLKKWQGRSLDGFGILIPHIEKSNLLGILFMSSLFKNRAPKNGALLTAFLGGVRNEKLCDLPENDVVKILSKEFTEITLLNEFNPDLLELKRYTHAIPQYTANTEVRLEAIAQIESKYPGLNIGGNLRDGIGMADRIKQAKQIANSL